eukprot:3822460-Pyramimonas_sp.AAC.1
MQLLGAALGGHGPRVRLCRRRVGSVLERSAREARGRGVADYSAELASAGRRVVCLLGRGSTAR